MDCVRQAVAEFFELPLARVPEFAFSVAQEDEVREWLRSIGWRLRLDWTDRIPTAARIVEGPSGPGEWHAAVAYDGQVPIGIRAVRVVWDLRPIAYAPGVRYASKPRRASA